MKKIGLFFLITLFFVPSVFAENKITPFFQKERKEIKNIIREGREASISPKEIREGKKEEIKNQIEERKENMLDKAKNLLQKIRVEARVTAKITNIGAMELTLTDKENRLYIVKITDKTRLIRRWGGKSNLDEFAVGDEVNVIGKWSDEQKTTIEAISIRNLSIRKRFGAFFGTLTEKQDNYFVIATINRGNQKVYFSNTTKFLDHKKNPINYSDLKIGDRLKVKGVWDKVLNEIKETQEIRVFPRVVQPTPTITVAP
jgi:hypothetical protein